MSLNNIYPPSEIIRRKFNPMALVTCSQDTPEKASLAEVRLLEGAFQSVEVKKRCGINAPMSMVN